MQQYEPVMSTRPKRPRLLVPSKTSGHRFLEVWGISHTKSRQRSFECNATLEKDMSPLMRQGS
jgi:hypothetical protein